MRYAIFNTNTQEIWWGPSRAFPGRIHEPGVFSVSPVVVGYQEGDLLAVTVENVAIPPSAYHRKSGETYSLSGSHLTITALYERTTGPSIADVKLEAHSRIIERYPEWKQRNMTMRAVELLDKKTTSSLSSEDVAEEAALNGVKDWIKAVRAASDAIEAMSPIPDDYADDARWPA